MRGLSPPLLPGRHDVEIVAATGGVLARLRGAIESVAPVQVAALTRVEPARVSTGGGTPLSIRGMNLSADMEIRIGSESLESQLYLGPTMIQGTSPPGLSPGRHAVSLFQAGARIASLAETVEAVSVPAVQRTGFALPVSSRDLSVEVEANPGPIQARRLRLKGAEELSLPGLPLVPMFRKRPAAGVLSGWRLAGRIRGHEAQHGLGQSVRPSAARRRGDRGAPGAVSIERADTAGLL